MLLAALVLSMVTLSCASAASADQSGSSILFQNSGGQAGLPTDSQNQNAADSNQVYSPPAGGYSSPYGYGSSPQSAGSNWLNSTNQGILSSRVQDSVLPSGLVLPIQLDTSIDINKCEEGDYVQAHITQNISSSGAGYLPGGSVFSGVIVKVPEEGHFGRSGKYSIDFQQVRFPTGRIFPLKAHLVGRIGTYVLRDPVGAGGKFLSSAWRNGVGSELSYGAGTTMGSYASHGYGPGGGTYAGAMMGGASQLLEGLFCHPHRDAFLHAGMRMEMQLDDPLSLPGIHENRQYLPGTGSNTGIFILLPVLEEMPPGDFLLNFQNR